MTFNADDVCETRHFIVAETEEVARGFFEHVCKWSNEVRGEMLVFESGTFKKDHRETRWASPSRIRLGEVNASSALFLGLSVACLSVACGDGAECKGSACPTTTSSSTGSGGSGGGLVCPASGVYHGPWSLHVDTSSALVRWDACKPSDATLSLVSEAGGDAMTVQGTQTAAEVTTDFGVITTLPRDWPGTYYLTEVNASQLQPGTCYKYSLGADATLGGRFCTARPSGQGIRFLAIGDTNPGLGSTEHTLDATLPFHPDFIVHLGDIQYYSSIVDTWSAWFDRMQRLLSAGAIFPVVGNHESENATEFGDYYTRLFGGAGFDGPLEYYRYESGGVWFFSLDTQQELTPNSPQGTWLAKELADAQKQPGFRFSVVTMHRPMLSCGDADSHPDWRATFEPIFLATGVKLVLAGHMHGYERFEVQGLTYVVSGGGGGLLGDVDMNLTTRPEEAKIRVVGKREYNALLVEIGPTSITANAVNDQGVTIDSFTHPTP